MSETQQVDQVTEATPVSEPTPSGEAANHGEPSQEPQGLTATNPMEQVGEEAGQAESAVPENYEAFKLGGDYGELQPEDAQELTAVAKELGLSQEATQKVVESATPAMHKVIFRRLEAQVKTWTEASKADKEFGGAEFNANMAIAKKAYDRYATPELKQAMNAAGLGCHPEFLRLFYRLGKDMEQDAGVQGGAQNPQQSWAKRLYPNTPQMQG